MSAYLFLMRGCEQRFLVHVDAPSIVDLAQELKFSRFLAGQLIQVDGEATSTGVVISAQQIALILEPE